MKIKKSCLFMALSLIHVTATAKTPITQEQSLHHFEADITGQWLGKKADRSSDRQISSMKQWAVDLGYSYEVTPEIELSASTHYQRDTIKSSYLDSSDVRFNSTEVGVLYNFAPTWYVNMEADVSHQYLADAVDMSDSRSYETGITVAKEYEVFGLEMTTGLGAGYSHDALNSEWGVLFHVNVAINEQWNLGGKSNGLSTGSLNLSYKPVDYLTFDLVYGGMNSRFFIDKNETMSIEHEMVGLAAQWQFDENWSFKVGTNYLFKGKIETESKGSSDRTLTDDLDNRMSYYVSIGLSF